MLVWFTLGLSLCSALKVCVFGSLGYCSLIARRRGSEWRYILVKQEKAISCVYFDQVTKIGRIWSRANERKRKKQQYLLFFYLDKPHEGIVTSEGEIKTENGIFNNPTAWTRTISSQTSSGWGRVKLAATDELLLVLKVRRTGERAYAPVLSILIGSIT